MKIFLILAKITYICSEGSQRRKNEHFRKKKQELYPLGATWQILKLNSMKDKVPSPRSYCVFSEMSVLRLSDP